MPNLGLADLHPDELGREVLQAWDDFLVLVPVVDLSRPSRLPGWTGRDVCVHLGAWDDRTPMHGLVASAEAGGAGRVPATGTDNAAVVAAHGDASDAEVLEALTRARNAVSSFFDSDLPKRVGRLFAQSSLGPLPLLSLVHASAYELAVHALDLAPCGPAAPSPHLLDRGLAALIDVTGALSARAGIHATVSAQTPEGGWAFSSGPHGSLTTRVGSAPFSGTGVRGSAADLLDASAGRAALPSLLVSRRLVVQQMSSLMRLAPLISEVPGLPGGAALRTGVAGLSALTGGVGKILGRFRR